MIVLVIAITVILIIATTTISMLLISRNQNDMINFIYDITTVEELVQDFYSRTGTLPTKTREPIDMEELNETSKGILSQLDIYDDNHYYWIDLGQLGTVSLRDTERGYFVNEGSLKVYVQKGTEYQIESADTPTTYYTLTTDIVEGLDPYWKQEEDALVVGNPLNWVEQANLRLVLPRRDLEQEAEDFSWDDWTFKWDFGPKTEVELAAIPEDDENRNFKYGDTLLVKSNGIYSIYIENPDGEITTLDVNVTKVDDRSPTYRFLTKDTGTELELTDQETGIKRILYKTLAEYQSNLEQAERDHAGDLEGRTEIDFYLLNGEGKDFMATFQADYQTFRTNLQTIQVAIDDENYRYEEWEVETDFSVLSPEEIQKSEDEHDEYIMDLTRQLLELYQEYPYFVDIYGKSTSSRLVLYVEDEAGNATVIGLEDANALSADVLARSYNVDIEQLVKEENVNPQTSKLKTGDYVDVGDSDGILWRIWEIDGNEVKITPGGVEYKELRGASDWINCESILNQSCQDYVLSNASELEDIASEIRNMKIEDFVEIKVVEKDGNKEYEIRNSKINEAQIKSALERDGYGKTNVEKWASLASQGGYTSGTLWEYEENGKTVRAKIYSEGKNASTSDPVVVKQTYWYQSGLTWKNTDRGENYGSIIGSGSSWLASPCVDSQQDRATFYAQTVNSYGISGLIVVNQYSSSMNDAEILPLVTLDAKYITGTIGGTESNPWHMM